MSTEKMYCPDLRLFGDGGAGGASGAAAAPAAGQGDAASGKSGAGAGTKAEFGGDAKSGTKTAARSAKKSGKQQSREKAASQSGRDADGQGESFDTLVKGRFKEDYGKTVQDIVTKRLKSARQSRESAERFLPVIRALGEKYGIDTSDLDRVDIQSLQDRISGKGEAEAKQAENDKRFFRLVREGRELAQQYPSFSMEKEMASPEFSRMVWAGVPVKTAYSGLYRPLW